MKEFAREFLTSKTTEEKIKFLNSLSKDIVWKMAEGNPSNEVDITSANQPIVISIEERARIDKAYKDLDI